MCTALCGAGVKLTSGRWLTLGKAEPDLDAVSAGLKLADDEETMFGLEEV